MTALVGDKPIARSMPGTPRNYPVATGVRIYQGAFVCTNAAGYLVPASDATALDFAGIAFMGVDNTSGANGAALCDVRTDIDADAVKAGAAQSDVGKVACILDDQTVGLEADTTYGVRCGRITEVTGSSSVRVALGIGVDDEDGAFVDDIDAPGGFRSFVSFEATLAADETDTPIPCNGQEGGFPFYRAGSVFAVLVQLDEPLEGADQTVTFSLNIDGTPVAEAELVATQAGGEVLLTYVAPKDTHAVAGGEFVSVSYTSETITNTPKATVRVGIEN